MFAKRYTILLTACINPENMIYTSLVDTDVRRSQYIEALRFYLENTDLPIVFVENTGNDISGLFEGYVKRGRLEYLTFNGNGFNRNRGKGYGEVGIMEYAFHHSTFLQTTDFIVKITGRLKIINITPLLNFHKWFLLSCDIQCVLDEDICFADSRFFIATSGFLCSSLLTKKEIINDTEGIYLEHILFDSICQQNNYVFFPCFLRPVVSGVSGTSGEPYWEGNYYKVKLFHLEKMLDCSIRYNSSHEGNASFMMRILLRVMKGGTKICCFLLRIIKHR